MDNIFGSSKKKTSSKSRKKSSSKKSSSTPKSIPVKVKSTSPQTIEEFNLKFPEPLPSKITFNEKISKKMNALFNKHQDIKPFIGETLFKDIFYLYLFNKYKTKCLITQPFNKLVPEMKIFINQTKPNINQRALKDLAKKLVQCISQNEPIIIIPLSLKITIKDKTSGHANLLIYRNNTRELEHFEPHGVDFQGGNEEMIHLVNESLDTDLDYLVKNMNDELDEKSLLPIKLIKAHEVCPRLDGVQRLEEQSALPKLPIEPGGYCVAWSMFFTEMCLKNPEIPSKQIYKAILDETDKPGRNDNYFKQIIRGYTSFINNKMAKYFTEILGYEVTSEKLIDYHKQEKETGIEPAEVKIFLYKLNYLIHKEAYPDNPIDIKDNKILKNTLKKYTKFKKTIKKTTSSSDLSDRERESRRHTRQLKGDYNTKLLGFINKKKAKDKERKATEKLRKTEEKERRKTEKLRKKEEKTIEKQRKLEEQQQKAIEKSASKIILKKGKTIQKKSTSSKDLF
jgi:hypothetical protein